MSNWTPAPGELIKMDFDPQAGHEQAGWRPAIVVSEQKYNASSSLAFVCPITNQAKGYPFEVPIPEGAKVTGVVLSDQLRAVDWKARNAKRVDRAPKGVLEDVRERISLILKLK